MGVVKVITPRVHFLHLPQSIVGEPFNSKKIIFLNPHPIWKSLDSNLHEFEFISTSMAHIFMLFVGPFLTFVASLHVCTLCMYPQVLQVRLLSSKKQISYTHTLFRGRSTRICMSSNLFRPLSHTFRCFWLAYFCLFGHFACVHIVCVPPSHTPRCVGFE